MNLTYNTNLPQRTAVPSRQQATQRMTPLPGAQFGAAYADNANAFATEGMDAYNRSADQANFSYAANAHQGQQGLALQGLQNMADEQQRSQQLGTARLQTMMGALRGLM
jgi:hypothetical protein